MSIGTRKNKVKTPVNQPAPVRGARMLFDSGTRRRVDRFGSGILPYVPHCGSRPYTASDADWWAKESNQPERVQYAAIYQEMREIEAELDRMAEESEWQQMYENGHVL